MISSKKNYYEIVKILIDNGADVNIEDYVLYVLYILFSISINIYYDSGERLH
jgi:hypothetical protein